jgi:hypothetical protein
MLSAAAPSAAAAPATDYTYPGPVFRTEQLENGQIVGKGSLGDVQFVKLTDGDGAVRNVAVKQFIPDVGAPARAFRSKFMKESAIHMRLAESVTGAPALPGL